MQFTNNKFGIFSASDTHPKLAYPSHRTFMSSETLKWNAMFLALKTDQPEFTVDCEPAADVLIVLQLTGSTRLHWRVQGKEEQRLGIPGSISIIPAGVRFHLEAISARPAETAHLYIRHQLVDELLASWDEIHLTPRLAITDPLLEHLIKHCILELKRPTCMTSLYTDGLAWSVAVHLVTRYRMDMNENVANNQRIGNKKIDKARVYIENNLDKKIGIDELASIASLSPIYFARLFKHVMGITPHQYILNSRIIRAQQMLTFSNCSTIEIAMSCGFCHQEHLHKVFRRLCGVTPGTYRRQNRVTAIPRPDRTPLCIRH